MIAAAAVTAISIVSPYCNAQESLSLSASVSPRAMTTPWRSGRELVGLLLVGAETLPPPAARRSRRIPMMMMLMLLYYYY